VGICLSLLIDFEKLFLQLLLLLPLFAFRKTTFSFSAGLARVGLCAARSSLKRKLIAGRAIGRLLSGHDAASKASFEHFSSEIYREVSQQSRINVSMMEQIRFYCSQNVSQIAL
jgi:hypothetical protein